MLETARQREVWLTGQHQGWVSLLMGWWEYGIRSWKKRAGPDATLTFLCELGPPPYSITGPDGKELSDR